MKTHLLRTSILALVVTAAGYAQGIRPVVANIPFGFAAGDEKLPAGQYTVDQSQPGVVILKSADAKAHAAMIANTVQRSAIQPVSKLVFHHYGSVYFLSQIWTEGNSAGRQMPESHRERELEARGNTPDKTIVLAMR